MKNYQAPRTLAECEFTTGNPGATLRARRFPLAPVVYGAICFGSFAAIGVLLALGV